MRAAHGGLRITAAAFDGVVAHLAGALAGLGVASAHIDAIARTLAPLRARDRYCASLTSDSGLVSLVRAAWEAL